MDEKTFLKLRVLERTEEMIDDLVEEEIKPKFQHPNHTNPQTNMIYKNMMKFHNAKIGEKFSVKDLFR